MKPALKPIHLVSPPTKKERFTLRLMITLGLAAMVFFLYNMLAPEVRGYRPLYWMLVMTFVFTCLKTIHEWCHYLFITIPETPPHEKVYTVDIFTTYCAGEPYGMIEETLKAIQAITYPHNTYLCDEADDPYLKKLCEELGVNHVTRIKKINAKAGNINNALAKSSGELCVVLDPDHVPFPDFLEPIVSHFNNPETGFVQIVQAYKNNDENLIAKGAAQQTYQFYGPMMMTMNKYGTVLAIGANCTFRRTALESIGGHAAGLAEDMHTAMQLHSKGWKSVYVPSVLARGLVPSTLSAYYKQQLKWSRGVFDLLLTAYPKLFKGFTWKQKIHYAVIPMHYLSGLIYLINFLIPIISLFFDVSPMRMNIASFGLVVLPFVVSTLLIRHFVQWWVMEDEERGFHVVGGLLMIGTWWIYILGLVYTIIGKKIPYVPTPKDGNEANNWPLNVPNLVVLALSLAAITYGLWADWNPYNLIMAGFAGLNSFILCFNIAASRQQQYKVLKERYPQANAFMAWIKKVKVNFWLMRRRLYAGVRSASLIITIILACTILYFAKFSGKETAARAFPDHKSDYFITGVFSPAEFDGVSSIRQVKQLEQQLGNHFDLVSVYIPWGDEEHCNLPIKTIDSIYRKGSVPMITWEPWQNLFRDYGNRKADEKVFKNITEGKYDQYLLKFSVQLSGLQRPVYLRFAHEMDNPAYPWSAAGNNNSSEFKQAWKYVYDFFYTQAAYNVIWVWNPWKAENATAYFPGKQYVDWIGVTNLNYGALNSTEKWTTMEELYQPFHQNAVFRSGLPVMLAEMGSLTNAGDQDKWFTEAFRVRKKFKEIKGFVFFNSGLDKNVPGNAGQDVLNWSIQHPQIFKELLLPFARKSRKQAAAVVLKIPQIDQSAPQSASLGAKDLFEGLKGMNYNRGGDWTNNYHTVTIYDILNDFKEMKAIGVSAVKRYGPDIYDRNILKAARRTGIKIHYGYWISDELDFLADGEELNKLQAKILQSVSSLKKEPMIVSWNIGNAVFQKLDLYYYKPELIYQQSAYLNWLKKLVANIRKIDPERPISVDVGVDENMNFVVDRLKRAIPQIDAYGLMVDDKPEGQAFVGNLNAPYFYSDVPVSAYAGMGAITKGAFISNWQDEKRIDRVVANGIKDDQGRDKFDFMQLGRLWAKSPIPFDVPEIKIMKPALGTFEGAALKYHALIKHSNRWMLADSLKHGFEFEWNLTRVDGFEKPLSMERFATGNSVVLGIPKEAAMYRIYLYVVEKGKVLKIVKSKLNTPLIAQ
ncbi:cellulose synthase (UDP-forming) [Pedobacter africanus]|uniref:Cellulose synthase/poly-beta-1,6-N-acetylglucosamine synthase-like glycosyltransferase n=1 Tax=Pedobacter africanus TaxID=151894 RepID=A0ACC6KQR7_9SPHI|nr:glycosyltransferase family 2 protein [Pedobacter africanus]MDR6781659.1 cellulose synthase/poly-beta-1,6-N-acetylglucosamine synthase-like glycosyltransferase [Pedobacter africanus]